MRRMGNALLSLPGLAGGFLLLGGSRLSFGAAAFLLGWMWGWLLCTDGFRRWLAIIGAIVGLFAAAPMILPLLKQTAMCLASGKQLPEGAAAAWTALGACLCIRWLHRGRGGWALPWLLLPAAVCSVTGGECGVWLYIPGLGLLILPSRLRTLRPEQAGRLAVLLLAPMGLMALTVWLLYPRTGNAGELRLHLISRGMEFFGGERYDFLPEPPVVSLRHDAPPDGGGTPVMEVTSAMGGTVYLRGRDFDLYTGTDWESTQRFEEFGGWGEIVDEITVRILGYENFLYLPYYPEGNTFLRNGMAQGNRMDYHFSVYSRGTAASPGKLAGYLHLPESTRVWAYDYLDGVKAPSQIEALVKKSGRYDVKTPAMPSEETDFVQWFAKNGQGYCTHFASLCVVLLRTAGIPARYVTGYLISTKPGEAASVTRAQAHAWAEFYDYSVGAWRILEATPSAEESAQHSERGAPSGKTVTLEKILLFLSTFALTVVYLHSRIRVLCRHRRLRRGSTRQRAYYLYGEAALLASLLQETPPMYLQELLQFALYSRTAPEDADLERFRIYCRQCLRRLRRKKLPIRLYHRIYRGAY